MKFITSKREDGVINLSFGTIENLIGLSIRRHVSISLHASPN